ncbi:MAG: phosphoglucosamine mutase, partial [Trebonia sp.]
EELGAEVIRRGVYPNGLNINDGCGALHPEMIASGTREYRADIGISLDGDGDRCILSDENGEIVDGDQILAMCALALRAAGQLRADTVVATVMSNLGFHHAMRDAGISVITTTVGDRYVLAELRAKGLSLGGEQSGHVVFTDAATTGDGLLTALHVMAAMVSTGRPLAELAAVVRRLPQTLCNVRVADKAAVADSARVAAAVADAQAELGMDGRILLRPSGTEQLVRVMVEASTQQHADTVAEKVGQVVAAASAVPS